jgi:hypothetical protein
VVDRVRRPVHSVLGHVAYKCLVTANYFFVGGGFGFFQFLVPVIYSEQLTNL